MYAAKFELLHAGLLVEAEEISDFIQIKPKKKTDDDDNGINVDDEEEEENGTVESIISRIDGFLKNALAGVGKFKKKVWIFN